MKKEDMVLLLAELCSYDCTDFLEEKNQQFLNSKTMKEIEEILSQKKDYVLPSFQNLMYDYEKLKSEKIKSIEEYFIKCGKASYLLYSFKNKKYINPLLCVGEEKDTLLKNLIITFDGSDMFLGDAIMKENYSSNYKIDCIKDCINKWRKEILDTFIYPMEALVTISENLPLKRKIPVMRLIYGFILLLANIFLLIPFFFKDGLAYNTLMNNITYSYYSYPFLFLYYFTFGLDFLFVLSLVLRRRIYNKYFHSYTLLFNNTYKIMKKLNSNTEKLYNILLNCINKKSEVNGNLTSFSNLDYEFQAFIYLKRVNDSKSFTEDHLLTYEIIGIQVLFVLSTYVIIIYFLIERGVLK